MGSREFKMQQSCNHRLATCLVTVNEALPKGVDLGLPLVCSLLVLAALAGASGLEGSRNHPKNRRNGDLKALVSWIVPPAVFLWAGAPMTSWPFAQPIAESVGLAQAVRIALGAGIIGLILSQRLRFQPFLLSLCVLSAGVLPFALTTEGFCQVFSWSFVDLGGLGMIATACAAFGLSAFVVLPSPTHTGKATRRDLPTLDGVETRMFLGLAWIAAAVGSVGNTTIATGIVSSLLAAGAAAVVARTCFGWIRTGTVSPEGLHDAMLQGILGAIPAAAFLAPQAGAVCGLLGLACAAAIRRILSRTSAAAHANIAATFLGGGAAGLFFSPFVAGAIPWSFLALATQWGVATFLVILGTITGLVFWFGLGQVSRLQLSELEEREGLDYAEHGITAEPTNP